jgi:arsenate reductase (thioredoxin)
LLDSCSGSWKRLRLAKSPVLFVCVENAGRSQMAEAFAKKYGMNAQSAGTLPSLNINPTVVQAMRELGVDVSKNHPKTLTPEMIKQANLVVTMGCSIEEACPKPSIAQMQKKLIEWHLEDPKGRSLEEVRKIRDEIETRVAELSKSIDVVLHPT